MILPAQTASTSWKRSAASVPLLYIQAQVKRIDHIQHSYTPQRPILLQVPALQWWSTSWQDYQSTCTQGSVNQQSWLSFFDLKYYLSEVRSQGSYLPARERLAAYGPSAWSQDGFELAHQGLRVLPLHPLRTLEKKATKVGCNSRRWDAISSLRQRKS